MPRYEVQMYASTFPHAQVVVDAKSEREAEEIAHAMHERGDIRWTPGDEIVDVEADAYDITSTLTAVQLCEMHKNLAEMEE